MKNLLKLGAACALLVSLSCARCDMTCKDIKSEFAGLRRTVVLYNCNGDTLHVWHTRSVVDSNGGEADFLSADGKKVRLVGTFTIVEETP